MRRIRELLLWAGAALGLLAVAAGLAVALGGFSFLVFRSGSMSPEIPTGGIALSRTVDAVDIRPGDVVSVTAANGERITHRVVSSTVRGDQATLVLKGDANATEDSELYVVTSAERVVASLPYGGYVVVHALTPPGLLAMACLSLMLVVISGGRATDEEVVPPRAAPRHRGRVPTRRRMVAGGALLAVAAGSGATVAHTTGTWASYTDKPRATGGAFAAGTLAPPTVVACTGSTTANRYVTWTASTSAPAPSYRVAYTWSNGLQTGSGTADVTTAQWRPDAAGLILNREYTVTVTAVRGQWTSSTVASTNQITATPAGAYTCT